MIVLVTGGRDYNDRARVFAELDRIHAETPIRFLFHGACGLFLRHENGVVVGIGGRLKGADRWADEWGMANLRPQRIQRVYADWSRGTQGGPERNDEMVEAASYFDEVFCEASGALLCLAFPGGPGTADCKRRARAAGIRVVEIDAQPGLLNPKEG